jgi:molybdate/tungstate transport system substrate-binding protein
MLSKIIRFTVCLLLVLPPAACSNQRSATVTEADSGSRKTPLVVFAAGSLIIPFAELEKAFEAENPDIDVQAEYHGSIQVMRHVAELHEEIDVVATADASLIPMLMYSSTDPGSGEPYADWYIRFASNRLAIAYRPQSLYASEINAENWPEILARPDVKLGLSDPRFDALGYRMLMAFALEENRRGQYNLFEPVFNDQFSFPVTIFRDESMTTVTVPEVLETKTGSHILMRGGSIMLIALLESGDLDYAFEYESVIRQHGLEMLSLPEAVNLGESQFESSYQAVQVNLDFQRFATVKPEFRGERIGYGITIPSNAPHPDEAARFINFLLSPKGRAIMESFHHPLFDLSPADGYANLPESLQALCVPADAP